ncbi:polysaccharide biosynthesis protein [Persicitalea jodogahamensis]|uniref:Capsular polysaccharide biosynthesis protein n=1 Tax=Persicitalea jodogahamensis TaxID=402147 RepID=A0A8J3DBB6_9BACT|nr:nucleoside-diphosphate sugar epimerase/dehydratase [Persicitalea jodogahamensis]GHB85243.1 capsular polysaccharide biosynthesis protein [Persicitalea jodogahamensis]
MIERLFRSVIDSYHHRFVSRRLILAIDLAIVAFSFVAAAVLRFNFDFSDINWPVYRYYLLFLLLVRWISFSAFRSYHGIVRHTSLEDAGLIFQTVTASSLAVVLLSYAASYLSGNTLLYIPISVLVIEYLICLFLMIASRFFVKSMYSDIASNNARTAPQDVIIYGAGDLGILTRNVLLKDPQRIYNILCFVDDNTTLAGKSVAGVRVVDRETAFEKYLKKNAKEIEVVLAVQNISRSGKKEILEYFLQKNILIKVVPSSNDWLEGTLSSGQIRKIRIEDLLEREPIRLDSVHVQKEVGGKVVAVTGAAGSIGSEIARQVVHYAPLKLVLIDQSESGLYDLEFELMNNYADLVAQIEVVAVVADITDEGRMRRTFRLHGPQIVFHAAAYKHVPLMERYPYEAVKTNVLGTEIVANLAVEYGVEKFVFVSTDKAVNPTNVMGATKRLAEMYVQSLNPHLTHNTDFIITRFGNVLGSNGSVVPLFRKQIQSGGPVTVTHPEVIRYFMTIPEACQLVLEAGAMGRGGDIFVFDMGEPVKIVDLARRMIQLSGLEAGRDIEITYSGLRPGEKLYEELLSDGETHSTTHHPKIMVARLPAVSFQKTQGTVSELKKMLPLGNRDGMVSLLKAIIPEYVSNNSEFEKLDHVEEDFIDPV